MPKRKKIDQEQFEAADSSAAKKTRQNGPASTISSPAAIPSGRKSILRGTPTKPLEILNDDVPTAKSLRRVLFTPAAEEQDDNGHSKATTVAEDIVARPAEPRSGRKRARQIAGSDDRSDEDLASDEAAVARKIMDGGDGGESEDNAQIISVATPTKRGRPKGRRRERTPSPPPDLPPHELFFFHHRTGGNKTSANTLPAQLLLSHEDYFTEIREYKDAHQDDFDALRSLHRRGFDQWLLELEQGFNVCLYGYGSKRSLVMEFAEHLQDNQKAVSRIGVVNGYTPGLTIRDVLSLLYNLAQMKDVKIQTQPSAALDFLLSNLKSDASPITLIVNSLDHGNLRKQGAQSILSRVASHPSISLVATCDNPNFPLLWDTSQQRQYRWLYHDVTTFAPYSAELEVVEDVNALLGRSTRRLGGKDGVAYVLRSLPENARSLFRILVAEQLASGTDITTVGWEDAFDNESLLGDDDEEEAAVAANTPSRRGRGRKPKGPKPSAVAVTATSSAEGVEYRTLYHKAIEEFVCSSEVAFRTLLKEFHDHQMIESRKDGMGTERLVVPFRREDLEEVLEELV